MSLCSCAYVPALSFLRFCVYAVRLGVGADAFALLYCVLAVATLSLRFYTGEFKLGCRASAYTTPSFLATLCWRIGVGRCRAFARLL